MTVIREAVIQIRTERRGSVGSGVEAKAFAAEARSAREAAKEIEGVSRTHVEHRLSLRESTRAVDEFGVSSVRSLGNVGRGTLQLSRGFALMAASSEKDSQRMLENLFKIEAGVSVLSGGAKLAQFASGFGPVGIAVAAVAATVGVATVAWSRHRNELEDNKRAAEELGTALLGARDARGQRERDAGAAERGLSREIGARRTGSAFSDTERGSRIDAEQALLQARLRALGSEDEARIVGEAKFRPEFNRPLRGTPAHRRRIEERRRQELEEPVGPEGFDVAAKGAEERVAIADRLLQLEREEFQLQQQKLQQKRQAAIEDSAGGLFGFASAEQRSLARGAADSLYEAALKERERKHQASADTIVEIWDAAAQKMLQISNALGNR